MVGPGPDRTAPGDGRVSPVRVDRRGCRAAEWFVAEAAARGLDVAEPDRAGNLWALVGRPGRRRAGRRRRLPPRLGAGRRGVRRSARRRLGLGGGRRLARQGFSARPPDRGGLFRRRGGRPVRRRLRRVAAAHRRPRPRRRARPARRRTARTTPTPGAPPDATRPGSARIREAAASGRPFRRTARRAGPWPGRPRSGGRGGRRGSGRTAAGGSTSPAGPTTPAPPAWATATTRCSGSPPSSPLARAARRGHRVPGHGRPGGRRAERRQRHPVPGRPRGSTPAATTSRRCGRVVGAVGGRRGRPAGGVVHRRHPVRRRPHRPARRTCWTTRPSCATGAGHDAGVLAAAGIPTAMLFVRNPTGVSHSPAEHVERDDCLAGVDALARVVADLAGAGPAVTAVPSRASGSSSPTTRPSVTASPLGLLRDALVVVADGRVSTWASAAAGRGRRPRPRRARRRPRASSTATRHLVFAGDRAARVRRADGRRSAYDGGGHRLHRRRHPRRRRTTTLRAAARRPGRRDAGPGHHHRRDQERLRPGRRARGARCCGWPREVTAETTYLGAHVVPGRTSTGPSYVELVTRPDARRLRAARPLDRRVLRAGEPARLRRRRGPHRAARRPGRRAGPAGARQPARARAGRAARRRAGRRERRPLHVPRRRGRRRPGRFGDAVATLLPGRRVLDPLALPGRAAADRRRRDRRAGDRLQPRHLLQRRRCRS